MINPGYKISAEEEKELRNFRSSIAYGTYLKSISDSPAFAAIMRDHIQNINIESEVKILQKENKLPDGINSKALNAIFKEALTKMAIGLVADTIILKELEDLRLSEVLNHIRSDSDIVYLLGAAEPKYYDQAQKRVRQGKIDRGSAAFQGLVAYMKKNKKDISGIVDDINAKEEKRQYNETQPVEKEKTTADISSNDIIL